MTKAGTAIVAGGSIGGLFVAGALLKAGWSVRVYERTGVELSGRGAGIVTHKPLIEALDAVGASTEDLGVEVDERVAIDIRGDEVKRIAYPQIVTSWDRIHQILRALMPEGAYRLGRAVTAFDDKGDRAVAILDDGSRDEADLIFGADGFRSAIRAQMLPNVQPEYAGYVVWRAVTDEGEMPPEVHARLFGSFSFFAPNGTQIVGYPIAGAGNDLRAGHRRYNFVWYSAVTDEELRDMLTDADGVHYPVSIPPPKVREDVLERMQADAARHLPKPFVQIIQQSGRPFFTPIYDHCSPVFSHGRVALAGDAACVARPHVGMGVTKAAQDAMTLATLVSTKPIAAALGAYSEVRVPLSWRAYEQGRLLGRYAVDDDPDANQDGRSHRMIDAIMRDTAVPVV